MTDNDTATVTESPVIRECAGELTDSEFAAAEVVAWRLVRAHILGDAERWHNARDELRRPAQLDAVLELLAGSVAHAMRGAGGDTRSARARALRVLAKRIAAARDAAKQPQGDQMRWRPGSDE